MVTACFHNVIHIAQFNEDITVKILNCRTIKNCSNVSCQILCRGHIICVQTQSLITWFLTRKKSPKILLFVVRLEKTFALWEVLSKKTKKQQQLLLLHCFFFIYSPITILSNIHFKKGNQNTTTATPPVPEKQPDAQTKLWSIRKSKANDYAEKKAKKHEIHLCACEVNVKLGAGQEL